MLRITISPMEQWDEEKQEFVYSKGQTLQLEHSLVSLAKWESKWRKPFLSKKEKTYEEVLDYIRCMTITQNVDPDVYKRLTKKTIDEIDRYIEAPMTAATFVEEKHLSPNREQVTAETIYYWMVALNIPFECQKWNLNRLITLIRFCNIKNQPPKKMSRRETMKRNAAINAARKRKWKTRG